MTKFELVWHGPGTDYAPDSRGLPHWYCTNEQCNRSYPSGRYEWFEAIRLLDRRKIMKAKFIWDPEGGPCCNDKILEACIFCDEPYHRSIFPENFLSTEDQHAWARGKLILDDPQGRMIGALESLLD